MARHLEQLVCDFLNLIESHEIVTEKLLEVLGDRITMQFGTSQYIGKEQVIHTLDEIANSISSQMGFRAIPVIIVNTEIPELDVTASMKRVAIALSSKLEEYVSWFIFIENDSDWIVQRIVAKMGTGYAYYEDIYQQQEYR